MIVVTEEAKTAMRALSEGALPGGRSLLLEEVPKTGAVGVGRVTMLIGEPGEGDEPVKHEGEPLLYVSPRIGAAYDGCVVDVDWKPEGAEFSIGPPLAGRNSRS